jgi:hypothetical protein
VVDVRDEELPSRFGGGFMSSEEQGHRVRASRDAENQARAAGNQARSGGASQRIENRLHAFMVGKDCGRRQC